MTIICRENFHKDRVANIAPPKGNIMSYIQELQSLMRKKEIDEDYIKLCSDYAQNLLNNHMPVIFDFKHLSLLLGLESAALAFYMFADEDFFIKRRQYRKEMVEFV